LPVMIVAMSINPRIHVACDPPELEGTEGGTYETQRFCGFQQFRTPRTPTFERVHTIVHATGALSPPLSLTHSAINRGGARGVRGYKPRGAWASCVPPVPHAFCVTLVTLCSMVFIVKTAEEKCHAAIDDKVTTVTKINPRRGGKKDGARAISTNLK